jgi:hypothetical protein
MPTVMTQKKLLHNLCIRVTDPWFFAYGLAGYQVKQIVFGRVITERPRVSVVDDV